MDQKTQMNGEQQFAIQRLYIKDLSFESPQSPNIFKSEWKPDLNLDINTHSSHIEDDLFEVILVLTVTVKNAEQTAFLIEIKYAGLFTIKGFNDQQLKQTLGSFCPSVLYLYAREVVTDVTQRGSFPQLILAPINFDALYQHHQKQKDEGKGTSDADSANA